MSMLPGHRREGGTSEGSTFVFPLSADGDHRDGSGSSTTSILPPIFDFDAEILRVAFGFEVVSGMIGDIRGCDRITSLVSARYTST